MFDVGFWELVLIALVALLVFGPQRLPRLVRETSLWVRKARSVVSSAKTEIDRELQLYELKQTMEAKRQQFARDVQSLEFDATSLKDEPRSSASTKSHQSEPSDDPQ
ncbi:MAG: twin-arginine translocase subunit TatB [Pseudomonadota bacterium]|jgi:sec-independent protein translocase protein TatB